MDYFLDLFSPETHEKFSSSDRMVSGFRVRHRKAADRIKPGDLLVCYLTRLSRWIGLLEVKHAAFEDSTPLFMSEEDPFIIRFHVDPLVWLPFEEGIPIHDESVWHKLSFTRDHSHDSPTWTGHVRSSLSRLANVDGKFLAEMLLKQGKRPKRYPLNETDHRKLAGHVIRRVEGAVSVTVPEDQVDQQDSSPTILASEGRESIRIQALLARIGAAMGLKIWIPANDRAAVTKEWDGITAAMVRELPLNYDKTTIETIERIDVLWLRGRSIVRAFEVEHTTAIYSGILRMADLLSLQPNMDIRLHIVAPEERRQKVFEEIRRPVFSLLERGPLSKSCTFLAYDSVRELARQRHLEHLSDSVLDEYGETAEEA